MPTRKRFSLMVATLDRCADQDSTWRRKDAPYDSKCRGDDPGLLPCDLPDPWRHLSMAATLALVGAVLATARRILVSLGHLFGHVGPLRGSGFDVASQGRPLPVPVMVEIFRRCFHAMHHESCRHLSMAATDPGWWQSSGRPRNAVGY
jgi:hypothetical protein